ncbi:LysR family transcriptional regulator [Verticiella sediminum]|uniref:LysR family transcriptional regulator n=1 Tax=Verticiella sediminum TaxID=1247510 RepID=A0A556A7R1_9BURK|nr:LysR family transcriptional regulator [Verticiella sediminum]
MKRRHRPASALRVREREVLRGAVFFLRVMPGLRMMGCGRLYRRGPRAPSRPPSRERRGMLSTVAKSTLANQRDAGRHGATQRVLAALRLRQLEVISTLADTGNMRAAGERLHMSTAAVSKCLREVEALFDTRIFHRLARGVVASATGELIVQRARVLLGEVAQLSDELAARTSPHDALLRIGAPPFLTWTRVSELLRALGAAGNLPKVRLTEGRLADICHKLDAGDIDVLITMNTPSELGGLRPEGFVIEQIGYESWVVVCAPGKLRTRGAKGLSWQRLREFGWILPPRPTHARAVVEQALLEQGLAPIAPQIESINAITNLQLAEAGLGLTLAARCTVEDRLARGTLSALPLATPLRPVPIAMVYRHDRAHRGLTALREAAQRLYNAPASAPSTPSSRTSQASARKSRV